MSVSVAIRRLPDADPAVPLPAYETEGAAGMDLRANFPTHRRAEGLVLPPMGRALVPTGLSVALPEGFELQIRPRSGLALKHGVTLANAPGTVDADYRGEIGVILVNLGTQAFTVAHGDRIAQAVLAPVTRAAWTEVEMLPDSRRGAGGFGSTGV